MTKKQLGLWGMGYVDKEASFAKNEQSEVNRHQRITPDCFPYLTTRER